VTAAPYPLAWPQGVPRTDPARREPGKFRTTVSGALENVRASLASFARDSQRKISSIVLSSNVTLGNSKPADPGIAAWFVWDGLSVCIAIDRYQTPAANLQAIHHIIEARRTELRHGTLAMVRATFTGFQALPAPIERGWWEVLGVRKDASLEEVEAAYRTKAKMAHPDTGGSNGAMRDLNAARDAGRKERAR
jgi:hypothetical protein